MSGQLLETACLPLYSENKTEGKYVPARNSLNMWNAAGRKRHENEIGIPIPVEFRNYHPDFFPGVLKDFDLILPNFKTLRAKQCQENGKALMSNPNKDLGKWLLRDILGLKDGTLVTYSILKNSGIDSVYIEKWKEGNHIFYKIFPAPVGEYDKYIRGAKVQHKASTISKGRIDIHEEIDNRHAPSKPVVPKKAAQEKEKVVSGQNFKAGDYVIHKKYGKCKVKSIDGDRIFLVIDGKKRLFSLSVLLKNNILE